MLRYGQMAAWSHRRMTRLMTIVWFEFALQLQVRSLQKGARHAQSEAGTRMSVGKRRGNNSAQARGPLGYAQTPTASAA